MTVKKPIALIYVLLIMGMLIDVYFLWIGLSTKLFFAYLSVIITLSGYSIYMAQMFRMDQQLAVKPHPLSWIGFGFLTGAGWLVQISQGGGAGSWCLGLTALGCIIIGGTSLIKFSWQLDTQSAGVAFIGVVLFVLSLFTRDVPVLATLSAIFAALADLAFYEPTFKKSWRSPHEESATNFAMNSLKCLPALLALQTFSVATTVYLGMLLIVNAGVFVLILYRRTRLRRPLCVIHGRIRQ